VERARGAWLALCPAPTVQWARTPPLKAVLEPAHVPSVPQVLFWRLFCLWQMIFVVVTCHVALLSLSILFLFDFLFSVSFVFFFFFFAGTSCPEGQMSAFACVSCAFGTNGKSPCTWIKTLTEQLQAMGCTSLSCPLTEM
jgi:hypothetical protein